MITSAASIGSKSFASTSSDIAHYIASLQTAEKAVHTNPKSPENWVLLATAALAKSVFIEDVDSSFTAISTARLALLKGNVYIALWVTKLLSFNPYHLNANHFSTSAFFCILSLFSPLYISSHLSFIPCTSLFFYFIFPSTFLPLSLILYFF